MQVNFSLQREEFSQLTPFAFNDCAGKREGDAMRLTAEALPYMDRARRRSPEITICAIRR